MHASNLAHGAHAQLSSILRILSHEPQLHVLNPCQHGHLHLQHKIHIVLRDIPLICIFFTVQATNPQTSRSSQIHISLHISIHWLPTKLPSFLYSEHCLSFSKLFQCSTFHAALDFSAFCTSMWHNTTQLCWATRWLQLTEILTVSRIVQLQWGSQESSEPATLHVAFLSEQWDLGSSYSSYG